MKKKKYYKMKSFKKINHQIFILVLLVFVSCNSDKEKRLKQEVQLMQDSIDNIVYKRQKLEEEIKEQRMRVGLIEKSIEVINGFKGMIQKHISKEDERYLDKKNKFSECFNQLKLNEIGFYNALINYNNIDYSFLSNIKRDSESLNELLDEQTIDLIISFFDGNDLYTESGAVAYFEALVKAYDGLTVKDKAYLKELYNANTDYKINPMPYVDNLVTTELDLFLNNSEDANPEYFPDGIYEFKWDVYSFWARRDREGNMELVYNIIVKIHNRILDNSRL